MSDLSYLSQDRQTAAGLPVFPLHLYCPLLIEKLEKEKEQDSIQKKGQRQIVQGNQSESEVFHW